MAQVVKKQYVSKGGEWVAVPVGGGDSGGLDQAAADDLYVNVTGDTMTGPLVVTAPTLLTHATRWMDGVPRFANAAARDAAYLAAGGPIAGSKSFLLDWQQEQTYYTGLGAPLWLYSGGKAPTIQLLWTSLSIGAGTTKLSGAGLSAFDGQAGATANSNGTGSGPGGWWSVNVTSNTVAASTYFQIILGNSAGTTGPYVTAGGITGSAAGAQQVHLNLNTMGFASSFSVTVTSTVAASIPFVSFVATFVSPW